jgi:hypothetical protein
MIDDAPVTSGRDIDKGQNSHTQDH